MLFPEPKQLLETVRGLVASDQLAEAERLCAPWLQVGDTIPPDWPIRYALALIARAQQQQRNWKRASFIYRLLDNRYLAGYATALGSSVEEAMPDWEHVLKAKPGHWCAALFGMMQGIFVVWPTYLQIRVNLEADVWAMLAADREDLADTMTLFADMLQQVNMETAKFLAKPFLYSGQPAKAYPLLMQAQQSLPQDPEIYYHLGHYYDMTHRPKDAELMWQQAMQINPRYWPAERDLTAMSA